MILIVLSLVVSCILLALIAASARSRFGIEGVCTLSIATAILFLFCLFSGALFLQGVLTLVAVFVCRRFTKTPRAVTAASAVAMVVSYAIVLSWGYSEVLERERLRKEYPLVSLADRLDYETKTNFGDRGDILPLSTDVEKQLQEVETRMLSGGMRSHMLASLHRRTSDEFVLARGFGPVRMLGVRRERVELPEPEPVLLPQRPEPPYSPDSGTVIPLTDAAADERLPERKQLLSLHTTGLLDFLSPERIGYVKDRHYVAGFQSHQFTSVPELSREWQIVRLDLVGLLKHEQPLAYVSSHLPRMDELRDAPTRPLDSFEEQAIARLQSEEDLVIESEVHRIRMVGSLRAGERCLECHSVRRGQLLGAFSYELVPAKPLRVPGSEDAPAVPRA